MRGKFSTQHLDVNPECNLQNSNQDKLRSFNKVTNALKSLLFRDAMRRCLVVSYGRSATTYQSRPQGSSGFRLTFEEGNDRLSRNVGQLPSNSA
jgi:hypothetical protein